MSLHFQNPVNPPARVVFAIRGGIRYDKNLSFYTIQYVSGADGAEHVV